MENWLCDPSLFSTLPGLDYSRPTCRCSVLQCVSQPCFNGGSCREVFTMETFRCRCVPAYSGERCELGAFAIRRNYIAGDSTIDFQ